MIADSNRNRSQGSSWTVAPEEEEERIMQLFNIEHSPSRHIPAGLKRICSYCPKINYKKSNVFLAGSQCAWTIAPGCVVHVLKMWSNRISTDQ
jgi:hypothetical protein